MVTGPPCTSIEALAVRLADEGVPLRAIARATDTPSATLRDTLNAAKADGRLIELPRDDWPPGFPRDQRALQISRLMAHDRTRLRLATQQVFNLSPNCAYLLLALLQNPEHNTREQDQNSVHVHINVLRRKLMAHEIRVETLWGYGYQLPADDRRKVLDRLLAHLDQQ